MTHPPSPSAHALATYAASPKPTRRGLALCLSGGGFRAVLFHLGALRRLNELGILSMLDMISSVSGGSIVGAHLVTRLRPWPAPGAVVTDWEERVAQPLRTFVRSDLRTGAILQRLLPWNWFRTSTGVQALTTRYAQRLTGMLLGELPERPGLVLCATDMACGVNWEFRRDRVGDYQVGYVRPPPADWTLARAVAASSCFPPIFNPMPIRLGDAYRDGKLRPGRKRDEVVSGLRLTDGGVYDNLALEPVWKSCATVLVSDGGATFDVQADRGLFWRFARYAGIVQEQGAALRKRWLISSFLSGALAGTYWGIGSTVAKYDLPERAGYGESLVDEVIAEVRTDMDAFSAAEVAVLENHGYLLADAAIAKHQPSLAAHQAPVKVPHPDFLDEKGVRNALRDSHRRKLMGRG
jgi:NTE family protein